MNETIITSSKEPAPKQSLNNQSLENSETLENLKAAFFEEASLAFRYQYFAIIAEFEGQETASTLFRELAEGGRDHVHGSLDFLRLARDPSSDTPIGGTVKNIGALLQSESHQALEFYPRMAKKAREEGFTDVASWFDTLEKLKQNHVQKLKAMQL